MNRSIRHWKDHYKPGAPLVFLKRKLINGVVYEPGCLVPQELINKLGRHRVKVWWESRIFRTATAEELAPVEPVESQDPAGTVEPAESAATAEVVQPKLRKKLGKS